jgi:hypothetical protein
MIRGGCGNDYGYGKCLMIDIEILRALALGKAILGTG